MTHLAPSSRRLREALSAAKPRGSSLRKHWSTWLRALRGAKRATGRKPGVSGRQEVEALLDAPVRPGAEAECAAFKEEFLGICRDWAFGTVPPERILDNSLQLAALVVPLVGGPVELQIEGWPPGFGENERARLLGGPWAQPAEVDPETAAVLRRRWDGFVLGGRRLRVRLDLPGGTRLPPVPRARRSEPTRRGRKGPWLPEVDAEGRRYLTPRALAERQAKRIAPCPVIDAYCGCGGNAVAFALAGCSVQAVEQDAERLQRAEANAKALGVSQQISFHCGRAEHFVPELASKQPRAVLFLDPPWGGDEAAEVPTWFDLFGASPVFASWLAACPFGLFLKVPRSFDLESLPGRPWELHYEFGSGEDDRGVVRMMSLLSRSPEV